MKENYWFSYGLELALGTACIFVGYTGDSLVRLIVCSLILACLFTAKLLICLLKAPTALAWVALVGALTTMVVFNPAVVLPLFAVLLFNAIGSNLSQLQSIAVTLVAAILLAVVLPQAPIALLFAALGTIAAVWGANILQHLQTTRKVLSQSTNRVGELEAQLSTQRDTIASIEKQGRQAERNRLAARIHDQIGHGVTGSVLMLEAAMIVMDDDPATARGNIKQATENLRASVDGIRAELREERDTHKQASPANIAVELERFEREHSEIQTALEVEGPLEEVSQTIWICIYESLRETLTNVLKHADATRFEVHISQRNRLVVAEFKDNGNSVNQQITKGIGLQSIEERCSLCGGKCFFDLTSRGFTTTMTFALRSSDAKAGFYE